MASTVATVILVEDDAVLLSELAALVRASGELELVGTASNVAEGERLLARARPAIVALDLGLPDGSGLSLIGPARERGHTVVVHTVRADDDAIFEALRRGAVGYVVKGDTTVDLVRGLALTREGGSLVSPRIARRVLASFASPPASAADVLTVREREVMDLFAHGSTYREVGDMLGMSVNTVRTHVRRAYDKLHVCSKAEAVSLLARRT
jgi:DNA-binding NarL/FixJ family response regulator